MKLTVRSRVAHLLAAMLFAAGSGGGQGAGVEVRVTEEAHPGAVQYHYVVANHSGKVIVSVTVGMDENHEPELAPPPVGWTVAAGLSSASVAAPEGWTARSDMMEESDKIQVEWSPSDLEQGLGTGQTLGGFALRVAAPSAAYTGAHWEVIFADGSTASGALVVPAAPEPGPGPPGTIVGLAPAVWAPVRAGDPVTWIATATGGTPPHVYQFWLHCDDAGAWRLVRDYQVQNTFSWVPARSSTCAIQVRVRNAGSTNAFDARARTDGLLVDAPAPLQALAYDADTSFPVATGTTVTWTASASGGAGASHHQYKFWMHDPAAGWSLLRDYGPGNSVSWTPLRPGTYHTQVWVRGAGSTEPYEAWRSHAQPITVLEGPVAIVSVKTDKGFPAPPGGGVTWTVEAAGGHTPLEYRFDVFDQATAQWTTGRDYGSAPAWTWTPAAAGTYAIRARVRATDSTGAYDASWESAPVLVGSGPIGNTSMTASQTFPAAVPIPLTFVAHATGGAAPLEYKFYLYDATKAAWTLVQDWSPSNQWSWSTTEADYGMWAVQAWIRPVGSTAAYEAYTGTGYFVLLR